MSTSVQVLGLGGSLRAASTSHSTLQAAVDGARDSGAQAGLIWMRDLDLPLFSAEQPVPPAALEFASTVYDSDALIWSTPTYHGAVSGSFKNALDWLIVLAERDPPYLSNKPVGLVSTAGGVQALQAINSLDFIARALRAWSVPLVLPIGQAWRSFDEDGRLTDDVVAMELHELGAEVVRAARQFQAEGTCDYADARQFAPAGDAQADASV